MRRKIFEGASLKAAELQTMYELGAALQLLFLAAFASS